jgi:hypothetical protein
MKLTRLQSAFAVAALFAVVGMIIAAGILWRPVWPGSDIQAGETAPPASTDPVPTEAQMRTSSDCARNQKVIETVVLSYYADEGDYPPAGAIDENHPLVVKGYLESPPLSPTGEQYVLYARDEGPPRTRCPSGNPDHLLPD